MGDTILRSFYLNLFVLLSMICAFNIQAADYFANVEKFKGSVEVNNKAITKKTKVMNGDIVIVKDKSYLKLKASDGTIIIVGPKSGLKISFNKNKTPVSLEVGSLRWISPKKDKKFLGVRTPNAILGVRGTDFFVERERVFDETQMVCFDGNVNLASVKNKDDSKNVGPGQWGGIGGRYSQKIGEIITLKASILKSFKDLLTE